MNRIGPVAALVLVLAWLAGCAGTTGTPAVRSDPTTGDTGQEVRLVSFSSATGSVPPPYNHVWTLTFDPADPDGATLVWRTLYAEIDKEWSAEVAVDPAGVPGFLELVTTAQDTSWGDDGLVGGGTYRVTTVDGTGAEREVVLGLSRESADAGRELAEAARALIPQEDFDTLEQQYQDWALEMD